MRLYFLRHAHALDGADDAARPLSPDGLKQCRKIARFLQKAEIEFDQAYSSPLVRAVQTAQQILDLSEQPKQLNLEIEESLLNEVEDFSGWLKKIPAGEAILLVGHAPSLAEHARRLVGIRGEERFSLSKAGLACVETTDRQGGALKFLISPKFL